MENITELISLSTHSKFIQRKVKKGQHNAKKLVIAEWTLGVEIATLGGDWE